MTFDYTEGVVENLGYGFQASQGQGSYSPDSMAWDCSISGFNFLYATSEQDPIIRETGKFRRERIDTERNPGEQSLDSGLWIRSQASWHYGAGLSSAEPLEIASDEASFRFYKSGGVDPWTPGQLQLLHDVEEKYESTGSNQHLLGVSTGVLHSDDGSLRYIPTTGSVVPIIWGGTGTINSLTTTGQYWLACNSAGIYRGNIPSGSGTKIYNKDAVTVTSSVYVSSSHVSCMVRTIIFMKSLILHQHRQRYLLNCILTLTVAGCGLIFLKDPQRFTLQVTRMKNQLFSRLM